MRCPRVVAVVTMALVTALVPLMLPAPAPASASVAPKVPYLLHDGASWTIHDGASRIVLPPSVVERSGSLEEPAAVRLLGVTPAGYVVATWWGFSVRYSVFELHLVNRGGDASRVYASLAGDGPGRAMLSEDGSRVLVIDKGEDEYDGVYVVTLDGRAQGLARWNSPQMLDFPGPGRLLFADRHEEALAPDGARLRVRHIKTGRTTGVTRRPLRKCCEQSRFSVGDLQGGVFAWEHRPRKAAKPVTTTFARIARPHRALWTARFSAQRLNPTARRVFGATTGGKHGSQIRRVRDGKILARFPGVRAEEVVWEGRGRVLVVAGGAILRCGVHLRCRTVVGPAGTVDLAPVVIR